MTFGKMLEALLLGILEGGTEFIPVSSTGHLLLATHFLKFETTGKTFEVLIQLGAILGVVVVYFTRLAKVAFAVPYDPMARASRSASCSRSFPQRSRACSYTASSRPCCSKVRW